LGTPAVTLVAMRGAVGSMTRALTLHSTTQAHIMKVITSGVRIFNKGQKTAKMQKSLKNVKKIIPTLLMM
jgi:hypothetical protein